MDSRRRVAAACLAAAAALPVLSACDSAAHRPPSGVAGCNHMFTVGDAGAGVGLDWDTAGHAYGVSVPVYVCEAHQSGGVIRAEAPSGVSISPAVARANVPSLLQFTVRVDSRATGALSFTFFDSGGSRFGNAHLPLLVTDAHGWHFAAGD